MATPVDRAELERIVAGLTDRIASLEELAAKQHAKIEAVDDWANGIMAAHLHWLPLLLKQHPEIGAAAMKGFEGNEDMYQQALRGEPTEMPLNYYEAQAILARECRLGGLPSPSGRSADPTLPPTRPDHAGSGPRPKRGSRSTA